MLRFTCLLILLLLTGAPLRAQDKLTTGKLELYATPAAVSIELPFTGDANANGSASFVWRKQGEAGWRNGVDMTIDRKHRKIWASIWPLQPGDQVEVKLAIADPDHPQGEEIAATVATRTLNLEPVGGRTFYVSPTLGDDANAGDKEKPFKTLAHAAKQVKPGDIVYALTGVYAEGDLLSKLKGTEQKPIVFAAAPGAKPVLDSSLVLDKSPDWQALGGGVFAITATVGTEYHGYVAQDGLRMFRYDKLADLQADKLKVRRAWCYDAAAKKLYIRTGTAQAPSSHRYNLSRHDYAVLLSASQHVVVRGFTMRYYSASAVRLSEGAHGCAIIDNVMHNVPGGIFMKSVTTAANVIWRNEIYEHGLNDFPWDAIKYTGYARQGIYCDRAGRGNSFCYNRMHGWFDCIAVESWKNPDKLEYNRDCDIMLNELYNAGDDAIEVDGGGVNMRIHGNAIRNVHSAISLAPIERGPVYVTRNHATYYSMMFKFNVGGCTSHGWTYIYHNSAYTLLHGPDGGTGISFPPAIPCSNKVLKNNVFIGNEWSVRAGKTGYVLDGNVYWHIPGQTPRRFQWDGKGYPTLVAFQKATKQEAHGQYIDPLLVAVPDIGKHDSKAYSAGKLSDFPLARDVSGGDLRLRAGSPCIDRALPIRGINDEHVGKGPDSGAFEHAPR